MDQLNPIDIARRRCRHHRGREAAARCPECSGFYCRECVTEHEGRVLCSLCLKAVIRPAAKKVTGVSIIVPLFQLAAALVLGWVVFYYAGRILLMFPSEFHEGTLWQSVW